MEELLQRLAEILVARSFQYGEFTLASGTKSAYYCDAKLTMLSPAGALLCGEAIYRVLAETDVEAAGGMAMGAAYLATAVSMVSAGREHHMHGFSVRPEQKDHGREQRIDVAWHPDGELLASGRKVAILEDVVTTGAATLKAFEAVEETGADIRAVVAILDRGAGGRERIRSLGVPFYSLFVADDKGQLSLGDLPESLYEGKSAP